MREQVGRPDGASIPVRSLLYALLLVGALLFGLGCQGRGGKHSDDDRLLAKIYDKSLYLSDMEGMIPEGMSAEDSALIISTFVRNWMRESSLLQEAENNVPNDLNLEKLVADYRASLIKNNYENIVMEKLLDSVVTKVQLQEFYEKNKDQYQLETPIVRCRFIKAPRNAPQINNAQDWWNSNKLEDLVALSSWSSQNATVHLLQDSAWYKVDDVAAYMPQGTLTVDNVKSRRDFIQRDEGFIYFFKVLELVSRKDIAPLSYIEGQARKVILHKRKSQLLEELKTKLYDEALRKKQVTVYD